MSDEIDLAQEAEEATQQQLILRVRSAAQAIVAGTPGTCRLCEEESLRLVDGACAPCRDKYKLP